MQALRFDGSTLDVQDIEPPTLGAGEARIEVLRSGICSTDLEIAKGYMGFSGTLGHEMVGRVLEHPDPGWIGRRVCPEINIGCGKCELCLRGLSRHCKTRTVLGILGKDGCHAEQVTMPVDTLHAVPDEVPDDMAAFVEPLAAAFEILEQVRIDPSWQVAVLGDGKLGSLIAMVLSHTGAQITVIGRHPTKLARLRPWAQTATVDEVQAARLDGSFDVAVEATGSPSGFERARALLRPRGTLVLKSTFFGNTAIDMAPLVIDEITLVGSRCGPYAPALRALANGRVDPSVLIEKTYTLTDAVAAMEHAATRGAAKILLTPGSH